MDTYSITLVNESCVYATSWFQQKRLRPAIDHSCCLCSWCVYRVVVLVFCYSCCLPRRRSLMVSLGQACTSDVGTINVRAGEREGLLGERSVIVCLLDMRYALNLQTLCNVLLMYMVDKRGRWRLSERPWQFSSFVHLRWWPAPQKRVSSKMR